MRKKGGNPLGKFIGFQRQKKKKTEKKMGRDRIGRGKANAQRGKGRPGQEELTGIEPPSVTLMSLKPLTSRN